MTVYRLWSNSVDLSPLHEASGGIGISRLCKLRNWEPFEDVPSAIEIVRGRSDTGKTNWTTDVSTVGFPFIVFSERARDALADILSPRGQFIPIVSRSRTKSFIGFFPTNPMPGSLDLERSDYAQGPNGKVIRRYALLGKCITDDWLFSCDEGSAVFVTEQFQKRVDEQALVGFDWQWKIPVSLS